METIRRSSKHEGRRKHHSSHHSHGIEKSANEERHRTSKDTTRAHNLSKHNQNLKLLSDPIDNDFIRNWLANTEDNTAPIRLKSPPLDPNRNESRIRQQNYQLPHHPTQLNEVTSDSRSKKRRRRNSSSDSSLLEPAFKSKMQPFSKENVDPNATEEKRGNYYKRQHIETSVSEKSIPHMTNPLQETFEKRARYKTRDDRYEPKEKDSKPDKIIKKRRSKPKPEKKGDRAKASKRASEDLMNNFSSKSIGQERLTIRPSHGPGLFKNGRASSPAKRRGLPDLAFSEMEFLQHSHRSNKNDDMVTSKSREKEKRKALRAYDEMSTFFKPSKTPLEENGHNARERSSVFLAGNVPRNGHPEHRGESRPPPIPHYAPLRKDFIGDGQPAPRSEELYIARGQTSTMLPSENYRETSKSGRATTFVSWSETQVSPGVTGASCSARPPDERYSSSPEPVRRSLKNTGIFKDTGIDNSPDTKRCRSREYKKANDQQSRCSTEAHTTESDIAGAHTSETRIKHCTEMPSETVTTRHPKAMPNSQKPDNSPRLNENSNSVKKQVEMSTGRASDHRDTARETGPTQLTIEHFNPETEWTQGLEADPSKRASAAAVPRRTSTTPATRKQLAQNARIKHLVTSVPKDMTSKDGSLQNGKTSHIKHPTKDESLKKIIQQPSSHTQAAEKADPHPSLSNSSSGNARARDERRSHAGGLLVNIQQDKVHEHQNPGSTRKNELHITGELEVGPTSVEIDVPSDGAVHECWVGPRPNSSLRSDRLPLMIEPEPLYTHQLQHKYREHDPHYLLESTQFENNFDHMRGSYIDEVEQDILQEMYQRDQIELSGYFDDFGQDHDHDLAQQGHPDVMWQQQGESLQEEMVTNGYWIESGIGVGVQDRSTGFYGATSFIPQYEQYELLEEHESHYNTDFPGGFWRPNRQY